MNSKNVVAISLIVFSFAAINIFLFGLLDFEIFPFVYLLFASLFMGMIIFILRNSFDNKYQLIAALLLALLLASSLTFFMSLLKGNNLAFSSIESKQESLNNEIEQITALNKYYSDYANYLSGEVSNYKNSTQDLESQIESARADIANTVMVPKQPIIEPQQEIIYEYEYEEEEEEDDDEEDEHEWEEDDD